MATGATNGEVVLYDLENPEAGPGFILRQKQEILTVKDVSFDPTGQYIAFGGSNIQNAQGYITIWDLKNKKQFGPDLLGFSSPVVSVKFSPDGQLLAGSSRDRTTRIWEIDGEHIFNMPVVLNDHKDWVWDHAFHPDSQSLLTASADGRIRYFKLDPSDMADQLCELLTRNMSDKEWRQYVGKESNYPWQETCPGKPKPIQK